MFPGHGLEAERTRGFLGSESMCAVYERGSQMLSHLWLSTALLSASVSPWSSKIDRGAWSAGWPTLILHIPRGAKVILQWWEFSMRALHVLGISPRHLWGPQSHRNAKELRLEGRCASLVFGAQVNLNTHFISYSCFCLQRDLKYLNTPLQHCCISFNPEGETSNETLLVRPLLTVPGS